MNQSIDEKEKQINKIYNGLQSFFAKRYGNFTASDYLENGKLVKHLYGYDFNIGRRSYHFDELLNFKTLTNW